MHAHTHKYLKPYCKQAKRSGTTVDAYSTTVMGAALKMPRDSTITDVPSFSPGGDLPVRRKKVGRWLNLLKTAHDCCNNNFFTRYSRSLARPCTLGGYLVFISRLLMKLNSIAFLIYGTLRTLLRLFNICRMWLLLILWSPRLQGSLLLLSTELKAAVGSRVKTSQFSWLSFVDWLRFTWNTQVLLLRPKLVKSSLQYCSTTPVLMRLRWRSANYSWFLWQKVGWSSVFATFLFKQTKRWQRT